MFEFNAILPSSGKESNEIVVPEEAAKKAYQKAYDNVMKSGCVASLFSQMKKAEAAGDAAMIAVQAQSAKPKEE